MEQDQVIPKKTNKEILYQTLSDHKDFNYVATKDFNYFSNLIDDPASARKIYDAMQANPEMYNRAGKSFGEFQKLLKKKDFIESGTSETGFDSQLRPVEEQQFSRWREAIAPKMEEAGTAADLDNYDLRGFWSQHVYGKDPRAIEETMAAISADNQYIKPESAKASPSSLYWDDIAISERPELGRDPETGYFVPKNNSEAMEAYGENKDVFDAAANEAKNIKDPGERAKFLGLNAKYIWQEAMDNSTAGLIHQVVKKTDWFDNSDYEASNAERIISSAVGLLLFDAIPFLVTGGAATVAGRAGAGFVAKKMIGKKIKKEAAEAGIKVAKEPVAKAIAKGATKAEAKALEKSLTEVGEKAYIRKAKTWLPAVESMMASGGASAAVLGGYAGTHTMLSLAIENEGGLKSLDSDDWKHVRHETGINAAIGLVLGPVGFAEGTLLRNAIKTGKKVLTTAEKAGAKAGVTKAIARKNKMLELGIKTGGFAAEATVFGVGHPLLSGQPVTTGGMVESFALIAMLKLGGPLRNAALKEVGKGGKKLYQEVNPGAKFRDGDYMKRADMIKLDDVALREIGISKDVKETLDVLAKDNEQLIRILEDKSISEDTKAKVFSIISGYYPNGKLGAIDEVRRHVNEEGHTMVELYREGELLKTVTIKDFKAGEEFEAMAADKIQERAVTDLFVKMPEESRVKVDLELEKQGISRRDVVEGQLTPPDMRTEKQQLAVEAFEQAVNNESVAIQTPETKTETKTEPTTKPDAKEPKPKAKVADPEVKAKQEAAKAEMDKKAEEEQKLVDKPVVSKEEAEAAAEKAMKPKKKVETPEPVIKEVDPDFVKSERYEDIDYVLADAKEFYKNGEIEKGDALVEHGRKKLSKDDLKELADARGKKVDVEPEPVKIEPKDPEKKVEEKPEPVVVEKKATNEQLIDLIDEYNSKRGKKHRRDRLPAIEKLAKELGVELKGDKDTRFNLSAKTKKGTKVKRESKRRTKEDIDAQPLLKDYTTKDKKGNDVPDQEFIDFVNEMMSDPAILQGIRVPGVINSRKAGVIAKIKAGNKSAGTMDLLDALRRIYETGELTAERAQGARGKGSQIALKDFLADMRGELTESERMAAKGIDADVVAMAREQGITKDNLKDFERLFKGEPYTPKDYEALKEFFETIDKAETEAVAPKRTKEGKIELDEVQRQAIESEKLTAENLESKKSLFDGFPYEAKDYETIKEFLKGEKGKEKPDQKRTGDAEPKPTGKDGTKTESEVKEPEVEYKAEKPVKGVKQFEDDVYSVKTKKSGERYVQKIDGKWYEVQKRLDGKWETVESKEKSLRGETLEEAKSGVEKQITDVKERAAKVEADRVKAIEEALAKEVDEIGKGVDQVLASVSSIKDLKKLGADIVSSKTIPETGKDVFTNKYKERLKVLEKEQKKLEAEQDEIAREEDERRGTPTLESRTEWKKADDYRTQKVGDQVSIKGVKGTLRAIYKNGAGETKVMIDTGRESKWVKISKLDTIGKRNEIVKELKKLQQKGVLTSARKGKEGEKMSNRELEDAMTLVDAMAEVWADAMNKSVDDFYSEYFGEITGRGKGADGELASSTWIGKKGHFGFFEGANVSSLAHEMSGHLGRRILSDLASARAREGDMSFANDLARMEKWVQQKAKKKMKAGKWETEHEEAFAIAFERYLRNGQAPTSYLKKVFENMQGYLREIYRSVKGTALANNIPKDVKDIFDRLLGKELEAKQTLFQKKPKTQEERLFEKTEIEKKLEEFAPDIKEKAWTKMYDRALKGRENNKSQNNIIADAIREVRKEGWYRELSEVKKNAVKNQIKEMIVREVDMSKQVITPEQSREAAKSLKKQNDKELKLLKSQLFRDPAVFLKRMLFDSKAGIKMAIERAVKSVNADYRQAIRVTNFINAVYGAGPKSSRNLMHIYRDVYGRGKLVVDNLWKVMPKHEQQALDYYRFLQRVVELDTNAALKDKTRPAHTDGMTKEMAESILKRFNENDNSALADIGITKEVDFARIKEASDKTQQVYIDGIKEMVEEGIITQKDADNMFRDGLHYQPRLFIKKILGAEAAGVMGEMGPKLMKEGAEGGMVLDNQVLLQNFVTAKDAAVAYNKSMREISDFIDGYSPNWGVRAKLDEATMNEISRIREIEKRNVEHKAKKENLEEVPEMPDFVYENKPPKRGMLPMEFKDATGKVRQLMLDKDMVRELTSNGSHHVIRRWLNILSGSPVLKFLATGINPEFAIRNTINDSNHILFITEQYSGNMGKAYGQLAADMAIVARDVHLRTGRVNDFYNEGGGMGFLSGTHGLVAHGKYRRLPVFANKLLGFLEYASNTSELMTRLALRERTMTNLKAEYRDAHQGREATGKALKDIQFQSTQEARRYLDFNQKGELSTWIDAVVPYFNANMQVTRGTLRAMKTNPLLMAKKAAQIGVFMAAIDAYNNGTTIGMSLIEGYNFDDDMTPDDIDALRTKMAESYKNDISVREKAGNLIVMLPRMYTDKVTGDDHFLYLRFPIDNFLRGPMQSFRQLGRAMTGKQGDTDMKELVKAWGAVFSNVANVSYLPPTLKLIAGWESEYDFFKKEPTYKGTKKFYDDKGMEIDYNVKNVYTKISQELGGKLSPAKLQQASETMLTGHNMFVDTFFAALDAALPDNDYIMPEGVKDKEMHMRKLSKTLGLRRILRMTYPKPEYNRKKISDEVEVPKAQHERKIEMAIQSDVPGAVDQALDDIWLSSGGDIYERRRLVKKFQKDADGKQLPKLVRALSNMSDPHKTANMVRDVLMAQPPENRIEAYRKILRETKGIKSIWTDQMRYHFEREYPAAIQKEAQEMRKKRK